MDWISDEQSLASTIQEKESILALFQRAVADYVCSLHYHKRATHIRVAIPLWIAYLDFVLEEYEGAKEPETAWMTVDKVRDISNLALAAVGWHYTEV